jgi:hypothetical protein
VKKNNPDSIQGEIADLERSINHLISALNENPQYIETHQAALESLAQAAKHLSNTVNKPRKLGIKPPSQQLIQTINVFVEYYINPQFYQTANQLKLPKAANSNHRNIKRIGPGD